MKRGISVFCLLLIVVGVATAGELAGHKMLVTSVRTGDTEVFVVDPDTGDARNLSRHPAEDRYPTWSPDGRMVAFTSNRNGAFNVYVMNADGSEVRQLTRENEPAVCYFPSWSGDGRKIVFGLAAADKAVVASVAPDGSDFKIIGEGRDPCISPDGRTIAFTMRVGQGYPVFAMDADGKNARQLTTHENEIGGVGPTWSPDGKKILYSDQVGDALEIFVCDADGKNQKQLTALGKMSNSAVYSPDMKWISFRFTNDAYWRDAKTRDKTYEEKAGDKRPVYVMRADGSGARVVEALRYQCAMDGSRAAWHPTSATQR